jgi:hypothetical protein
MLKIRYLIILLLLVESVYAHNPQVSTISIIQNENKKWSVFITAPLYTYQLAIKDKFPQMNMDSISLYEIQKIILDLVKNNLIINGDTTVKLMNDKVQLAHETTIFFDINNDNFLPTEISFTAFSKLYNHFTLLKIVSNQSKEITYILNNDNKFHFPKMNETRSTPFNFYLLILPIIIVIFLFSKKYYNKRYSQKNINLN